VLLGIVATPCATPPLVAVVSVASAHGNAGFAGILLLAYALGHGLPGVLLGLLAGNLQSLERLKPLGRGLQVVGGWLIIAVGFWLAVTA
jgi:cytochrome c-type biogenesis protein